MHRLALGAIGALTILLTFHGRLPTNADTGVFCNPKLTVKCKVIVTVSGHPATSLPGSPATTRTSTAANTTPAAANPCPTMAAVPQPPHSDPVWLGHRTGKILVQPCWLLVQMGGHPFWAPPNSKSANQVLNARMSPALLARRAVARLQIPKPVMHRSPSTSVGDVPVTWVNAWTWVWTTPSMWHPLSKTASIGDVWATVTVTPTVLTFHPGLGTAPPPWTGPGRAWTAADGNGAPTRGGHGFMYRSVSAGVKASLQVRWAVSWTGSGGSAGTLPAMTTRTTARFAVEQIQVVSN